MRPRTILGTPGKLSKPILTLVGFLLTFLIGLLDYITGYDFSVSALYLFPVMLLAWYAGAVPAILISIISAVVWALADLASGHIYSSSAILVWNALMLLGIFLIVSFTTAAMKKLSINERDHDHNDYWTRVTNAGRFYEQVSMEIVRSARYNRPLTIAYLDIDNLKRVNDTLGRSTGDDLLRTVVATMKTTLRSTDIISRLGGDEFAVLMPETKLESATAATYKVRDQLLETMGKNGWPITFSIGVAVCYNPTCTAHALIKKAETLMYAAKNSSKNMVKFEIMDW